MTHLDDLASAYLDGEIAPGERAAVEAHLDACGECRGELAELVRVRSALRSLPVLEAPPGLGALSVPEVMRPARHRRWFAAAAVAVLVGGGVVGAAVSGGREGVQLDLGDIAGHHVARTSVDPGFNLVEVSFVTVRP